MKTRTKLIISAIVLIVLLYWMEQADMQSDFKRDRDAMNDRQDQRRHDELIRTIRER